MWAARRSADGQFVGRGRQAQRSCGEAQFVLGQLVVPLLDRGEGQLRALLVVMVFDQTDDPPVGEHRRAGYPAPRAGLWVPFGWVDFRGDGEVART